MTPQSFREMAGKWEHGFHRYNFVIRWAADGFPEDSKSYQNAPDALETPDFDPLCYRCQVERRCDEWRARVDDLAEDEYSEKFVLGIIGERGDK